MRLGQAAVLGFLVLADALRARGDRRRAQPRREDPIVALAEAREKLLVGQLDAFRPHRVAPRQPVKLLGIDERPVEIPQNRLMPCASVFSVAS